MGIVDSHRPPLPAPTESNDENSAAETEVATNVTSRTDKTSWSIPEDGRPITISTQKVTGGKNGSGGHHSRDKSQTSLLIEYFEASKTGDKSRSRPSVRVKVTPSAKHKSKGGNESIQITGIGTDRKPSYTRRISLGNSSKNVETGLGPTETEISHSSESNVSGRPPVEIEVNNGSDISNKRSSRGLMYAPVESNVSSMPPDSMLEGRAESELDRSDYDDDVTPKDADYLRAPAKDTSRSRSASRDRLTQKVMEKLGASSKPRKYGHSTERDYESHSSERRRRSSKSQRGEEDTISGAESSLLSSNLAPSQKSHRSSSSQASRMTNNPKLLEMVEDTIKRMILPEINAIKEDQKTDRKLRKFSESGRDSAPLEREGIERRVSKSTSSPNISSKPKVVLNRDGDDPGTVLSRGDSERVKHRKSSREYSDRPSSRRSSGRHSREASYDDTEERIRHKSSRGSNTLRGAAAAGLAGGALTAAALKHHDSQGDMQHKRKKRSKSRGSRSRSASITETDMTSKEAIPPMPLASKINDSEVTRESILSQGTDRPKSQSSVTPIREVSRGSVGDAGSPVSSRTPTRTPISHNLGMSLSNHSIEGSRSPRSPNGGLSNKARLAKLTAAGLGAGAASKGTVDRFVDADGYGEPYTQQKVSSPAQSVSSLRKNFEEEQLVPQGVRPKSAASRSSAGRLRSSRNSQTSLRSTESPPTTTKLADSRKQSQDNNIHEYESRYEAEPSLTRSGAATPSGETADEWFERQHLVNDRYRDSFGGTTNRDSYTTNPYPQDEHRFAMHTEDSMVDEDDAGDKDLQDVGLNPNYVHTPLAVESAVASLMEPSTVSSHVVSSTGSPAKTNGTYSDRMAEHLRTVGKEIPPMYEGSTLSQSMPSHARWAAIKGHAKNMSGSLENLETRSPEQSPARSTREKSAHDQPIMSSSGLPLADDPMPEIGHYDDSKSDVTTNPSIIHGPLGGDATGKSTWPYTPEQRESANIDDQRLSQRHSKDDAFIAAAAGGAAALAGAHAARQATVEDEHDAREGNIHIDREATPTGSPAYLRDEGYVTDGRTRSGGNVTPRADQTRYGKKDLEEYARVMDAQDLGEDDPFGIESKHARHFSGNSHGMESPLYDSSTGKGLDRIDSKDIVALMDHLTVRDAQRNARDTEILVTLVRSAAEMRSSFDEMKKFILEQDKMIMQNTDRGAEHTAQKVLSGPRPQPIGSPRTPRRQVDSEEDVQVKRKGVLRRALKGLTGGKSGKDLAKIEDMLMQILDNVEDLKHQGGGMHPPLDRSYTNDSLDSYEKLRNAPDPGYEPEGQAGTSSTPSQSGHFNVPAREKHQFHSGYDGRRGSDNRVSTVLEDDEDELEPHEDHVLNHQFENNERLMSPTQDQLQRSRTFSPAGTPPQQSAQQASTEKQRKHKSTSSSLFGVPKISRWSRTTTSSAAPDPATLDSPQQARNVRPVSESSRSRSTLDQYDDEIYDEFHEDERMRSTQSLSRERRPAAAETRSMRSQASSKISRTPSPLIPSEASTRHRDEYDDERVSSPIQEDDEADLDDPKYHAHRNSLLLQHPQPRPGPTPRHQNALESQAQTFDDPTGTNSDLSQRTVSDFDPAVWGSSGTAGLARHRLTQVEPLSPVSMSSSAGYGNRNDNGPLVPQSKPAVPPKVKYEPEPEAEPEWEEPQFSNSGFSKGGYYSSPYGSGHLLEPIEEVRYSLETDSGHISPEPQMARAVDMRSPTRKITGPRPMGSQKSPAAQARLVEHTGTVRRKPVPGNRGSRDSFDETF